MSVNDHPVAEAPAPALAPAASLTAEPDPAAALLAEDAPDGEADADEPRHRNQLEFLRPGIGMGVGTIGSLIMLTVKAHAEELGIGPRVRFLFPDTDNRIQTRNGLPAKPTVQELCIFSADEASNALKNPQHHAQILRRFDLQDTTNRRRFTLAIDELEDPSHGSGQLRVYGALRFATERAKFVAKLEKAASDVTELFLPLQGEMDEVPAEDQGATGIPVYVPLTLCGGSASSYVIDLLIAIRTVLPNAHIRLFVVMPDVLDGVLSTKARSQARANTMAALREIEYFQQGLAHEANTVLHYMDGGGPVPAPTTLFNRCYLIERKDLKGNDLGSLQRVCDAVALAIITEMGLPIGDAIRSDLINQQTVDLAEPCAETGLPRRYSTVGATALRIADVTANAYVGYRDASTVLENVVLGAKTTAEAWREDAKSWLAKQRVVSAASGAFPLGDLLWQDVDPRIDQRVEDALGRTRSARAHPRNGAFLRLYEDFLVEWPGERHLKSLAEDVQNAGTAREAALAIALQAKVAVVAAAKGLRSAHAFLIAVSDEAKGALKSGRHVLASAQRRAPETLSASRAACKPLKGLIARFRRKEAAQADLRTATLDYATESFRVVVAAEGLRVVSGFASTCETWEQRIGEAETETSKGAATYANKVRELRVTVDRRIGVSKVEVNLLGAADLARLLPPAGAADAFAPPLLAAATAATKPTAAQIKAHVTGIATRCIAAAQGRLAALNVADVLALLVEEPASSARARGLLKEVLRSCNPLWSACSPAGQVFPESVVVGLPAEPGTPGWIAVQKTVAEIRDDLNVRGHNVSNVELLSCHDPCRIYVTRRSHGARPHYLASVQSCVTPYRNRLEQHGVTLHVFPRTVVSQLPKIVPDQKGDADRAFALGLATGFVAQRGNNMYYTNLRFGVGGVCTYETLVFAQNDGLLFAGAKPREDGDLVRVLLARKLVEFIDGKARDETLLGQGRDRARSQLAERPDDVRLLLDAFTRVVEAAGREVVANALEAYARDHMQTIPPEELDAVRIQAAGLRKVN